MATASVSAASDSQFSVSGGDRVASRWAWTVLRVACLTFQAVLDLASALIPQDGGLPEAASLTGRLHLCALKREPCLPACLLSHPVFTWPLPRLLERCPWPGWCTLRHAKTKLHRSRERNGLRGQVGVQVC